MKPRFPEVPKNLVFEYNFSDVRKVSDPDIGHIHSIAIEDYKIKKHQLDEEIFDQRGFPFDEDELTLFESGLFGVTSIKTKMGVYEKTGAQARLDDLGERGQEYTIVTLEYKLKED